MEIVTTADRPDLDAAATAAFREQWPEFIFHDEVPAQYMPRFDATFARYDVLVIEGDAVLAGGWGVPLRWDGTVDDLPEGYDGALVRAFEGHDRGDRPTTLSLMAAAVATSHSRRGLAQVVLTELARRARDDGMRHVIAPLRPTWKHRYPTFPMAQYARWVREDGMSVDPWIRAHQRMGARILAPAARSMVVEGSVGEWERWADMPFPDSGDYVVPGALSLVRIDRERDRGRYVEENLWVQHS